MLEDRCLNERVAWRLNEESHKKKINKRAKYLVRILESVFDWWPEASKWL